MDQIPTLKKTDPTRRRRVKFYYILLQILFALPFLTLIIVDTGLLLAFNYFYLNTATLSTVGIVHSTTQYTCYIHILMLIRIRLWHFIRIRLWHFIRIRLWHFIWIRLWHSFGSDFGILFGSDFEIFFGSVELRRSSIEFSLANTSF